MKTGILIDSTVYMSNEDITKYGFYVVPLSVNFDDASFTEVMNDSEQVKELFDRIDRVKTLARTSQPSTQVAIEKFAEMADAGYERIISLHLSSSLSGTTQGMKIAAEQFMEENANVKIEVYDTTVAAQVAGVTAKTIAKYLAKHGEISSEKITEIIKFNNEHSHVYVFVDNLDYLAYGGRIPAAMASIGNLFGITPVITLNEAGGLEKYKSERSQKRAVIGAIEELKAMNYSTDDKISIHSLYTTEDKMASKMLKEFTKATEATVVESDCTQLGIVIANHLGPKSFGIFWIREYTC